MGNQIVAFANPTTVKPAIGLTSSLHDCGRVIPLDDTPVPDKAHPGPATHQGLPGVSEKVTEHWAYTPLARAFL
jgi:hypothetical protein